MSTPQPQSAPQAPQITTTSPAGHTTAPSPPPAPNTNVPIQHAAATAAPTTSAPVTTSLPAIPPVNPASNTPVDLDAPTYNEQLNDADRYWKFKTALQIALILAGIVGIGCLAWAIDTANKLPSDYAYGFDSTWSLPWGLITFSISVIWCLLCILLFVFRKRPVHPGVRVTMDLLLWLGFLVTALFTMVALIDVLQWGADGQLGYSWGGGSRYGDYILQKNNTWVWEQDSSYSGITGYDRSCNGSSSSSYSYYADSPFRNCAEMDAYVNQLWAAKPNRARVELTAVVCQFLSLVLHFALFVWACVDCHAHRHSRVSKDAEKIAAGIVQQMVQNGAIVPPPGQAHVRPAAWQQPYHQLSSQPNGFAAHGQGYPVQGQQHPMYAQPMRGFVGQPVHGQGVQQRGGRHPVDTEGPLPPLPPRPVQAQAGPSNEKAGGVAASYYEPGQQ